MDGAVGMQNPQSGSERVSVELQGFAKASSRLSTAGWCGGEESVELEEVEGNFFAGFLRDAGFETLQDVEPFFLGLPIFFPTNRRRERRKSKGVIGFRLNLEFREPAIGAGCEARNLVLILLQE